MPIPAPAEPHVEPCSEEARVWFTQLWAAFERSQRDIQVAWETFLRSHGLPLTWQLDGVREDGLLVKGDTPPADG